MKKHFKISIAIIVCLILLSSFGFTTAQKSKFKVIAFYTAQNDLAHISFVHQANVWFPEMGKKYHFTYDSTNNWDNLNEAFLKQYQVVLFLDTRPETSDQREAFQTYMEHRGGWIGFHFAAFALNNSKFPQNWDWYQINFFGGRSI